MASYNENLIFLLLLLLITILFWAPSTGAESPECSKINSAKEICTLTQFPNSCYNTLVQGLAPNDTTQPEIIYMKSVQVAMAEVQRTAHDFSENGKLQKLVARLSNDKIPALSAMGTCREVLALAMDNVNQSSLMDGSSLEKSCDNIRTRLSAAATDLQTCQDGFEDLSMELRSIVVAKLKRSTEYTSNTLAIATEIGKCESATRKANSNARK
ncbi:Pectinesterase [Dorcoceras hygrometricum]|uniref:Pectinesterase n=1 Tax=Dorcoceras hygrometricum TaxID=472368 RepID=A0A2Z7BI21_9LAMI|nr:Pectinesterase [Dorcoceras hygrometricum]